MKQTALLLMLSLAALLAFHAPAHAQDASLRERAKKLVDEGQAHQGNKEWKRAAEKYLAAYDLVPHPDLLYNLGQVARLGGDKETALQFYRKYLAVSASGALPDSAREFVATLEAELGKIPFRDPLKAAEPDPVDVPATERLPEPLATEGPEPAHDDLASTSGGSKTLRIASYATFGLGAALLGGGVYYGLRAKRLSDDLSEIRSDAWTERELQKDKDGRAANRNMIILSVAGGVAVATGAALFVVSRRTRTDSDTTASLGPAPDGTGVGLVVAGSF